MTNKDYIKDMTDEQLSDFLFSIYLTGKLTAKIEYTPELKQLFSEEELTLVDLKAWLNDSCK